MALYRQSKSAHRGAHSLRRPALVTIKHPRHPNFHHTAWPLDKSMNLVLRMECNDMIDFKPDTDFLANGMVMMTRHQRQQPDAATELQRV